MKQIKFTRTGRYAYISLAACGFVASVANVFLYFGMGNITFAVVNVGMCLLLIWIVIDQICALGDSI